MSDVLTPDQRHRNMAAIHSVSTKPELVLRHALWRKGFRYRVNDKRLPGKPDIMLPKYRTIIFVHGCFWHGHKGCSASHIPETNNDFWTVKIFRNQERDQAVWRQLEAKGWFVIIVWECELKKACLNGTIERVVSEIKAAGEKHQQILNDRKAERVRAREEREARRERMLAIKKR
jgi:DNA mismatch endonuclease (patch repair protein)